MNYRLLQIIGGACIVFAIWFAIAACLHTAFELLMGVLN